MTMKRILFFIAIMAAMACNVQAALVHETEARQVASQFFSAKSSRFLAPATQSTIRLAYTAKNKRFYVFSRGEHGPFVVVSGDDRLPQVLGYGNSGDFSAPNLPPAVQYWMDQMNRQIAFLQTHADAAAHQPAKQATVVDPLLTTQWDQGAPYNDQCPTYEVSNGNVARAVTGCVATGVAQVMNYYKWPDVGTGSHSYVCNVNDVTRTELSADYSQSFYQWDLMLDYYDANSSPESCDAVAKLMSDVGISMDMGYGASSGASEVAALNSLKRYFKYNKKSYLLNRDLYSAEEWDHFLVDEITAGRPIVYCGYSISATEVGGHCFVLDGFDADGYYHVNWGWGGVYDGNFLVSVLAPSPGTDFAYGQDGIFGLVPDYRADEIKDVLYIRSQLIPATSSVRLGDRLEMVTDNFTVEGNMLDTAGYQQTGNGGYYYALIPMKLSVFDSNGVECQQLLFDHQEPLSSRWGYGGIHHYINLSPDLADGEYKIKMFYSIDKGANYDQEVRDFTSKELYIKMTVRDGIAYLSVPLLANVYGLDSFVVPSGVTINQPFTVGVNLSYFMPWSDEDGPVGNVYLSLLKNGEEVATSELCEVMVHSNEVKTYEMELMAPAEWGKYDIVANDESGNPMEIVQGWYGSEGVAVGSVMILPPHKSLVEDFESMTANNSTSAKDVQGNFTTWNFYKCGVRAPEEDKCHGEHSVMMKKPSYIYTGEPIAHDFFMAQATFFNPAATDAKYRLSYSVDGGSTWETVNTYEGLDALEVPGKSETTGTWILNLHASQPALFRITMFGGGTAATYMDDFSLYFTEILCDINIDGEVNIADVNAVVDAIIGNSAQPLTTADANGDGEINIGDINTVLNAILSNQ